MSLALGEKILWRENMVEIDNMEKVYERNKEKMHG